MGFRTVYLIGFDYKRVDGKQHYYHKEHPSGETNQKVYDTWMFDISRHRYTHADCRCPDISKCNCDYKEKYKGYNIINLSLDSALDCFPKVDLCA